MEVGLQAEADKKGQKWREKRLSKMYALSCRSEKSPSDFPQSPYCKRISQRVPAHAGKYS